MKNKTKSKKTLAAITAFLLIGFILYIAQSFMGNPVSKMMADNSAKRYIDKEYKDLNLELDKAVYNFKTGRYTVDAQSLTSTDTHFEIDLTAFGKVSHDSYEDEVLNKWNTWQRINDEYKSLADTILNDDFPYKTNIAFGQLRDVYSDYNHLELDKRYDIKQIGAEEGKIILYIESESLDKEKMAEVLLQVKEMFDKKDIPFYAIDLTLENPRVDNLPVGDSIELMDFLYKDIYEENLEERAEENIERTKRLYDYMDKEKEEEIVDYEKDKEGK